MLNPLLTLLGIIVIIVILCFYATISFAIEKHTIQVSVEKTGLETGRRLSSILGNEMWNLNYAAIISMLQFEAKTPDIHRIMLFNDQNNLIVDIVKRLDGNITTRIDQMSLPDTDADREINGSWVLPIIWERQHVGSISLSVSNWQRSNELTTRIVSTILVQLLFSLILVAVFFIGIRFLLVNRLVALQQAVLRFSGPDWLARAPLSRLDEIGQLALQFNNMADLIHSYVMEMETQVSERTSQLVESEKLAFLGSLVAGIAHEINTPVGVSLTAITYLETRVKEIQKKASNNELTKNQFDDFLTELATSADLIGKNMVRTSDLVRSFKGVGSDQLNDDRRKFKLKEYIDDVVLSLSPKLRKTPHKVEIVCPEDLSVTMYPSAIYQIISNLIINSLIHGFDPEISGLMKIEVSVNNDWLELKYSDSGVGIPEASLNKLFTPFFTTRRGQGGTGLGLYIIYTIVGKLNGTITCKSQPGHGVLFTVRLPTDIVQV